MASAWSRQNSQGLDILGCVDEPAEAPVGVVVIVHGFLGYKDYGMFPRLARTLARAGFIVHRYNHAHSGMTNAIETFERPDLFERDTWMHQVADLDTVIEEIASGSLAGAGLPIVLLGHSRGGATVMLNAGQRFRAGLVPLPAGVITLSAPATTCGWDADLREEVLEQGHTLVRSSRTGQTLRIDAAWLVEQLDDPSAHDVLAHARDIACPMLVVHGEADPTVPCEAAHRLVAAAGDTARLVLVEGGNHVFQTPNPDPPEAEPSDQLRVVLDATTMFARSCVGVR